MVDKEERRSVRVKWAQEDVAEAWEKVQDIYRDMVSCANKGDGYVDDLSQEFMERCQNVTVACSELAMLSYISPV